MQRSVDHPWTVRFACALFTSVLMLAISPTHAQQGHPHHPAPGAQPPAPFIASTARSFAQLMDDAMVVMDHGMRAAPMNDEAGHDFVTMMIPHHQGAIDMAKALLLYTKDPELMNLAQGIITEQQNEIRLMQGWLERHHGPPAARPGARREP